MLGAAEEEVWGGGRDAGPRRTPREGRKTTDRLKQCEIIAGRYDDNIRNRMCGRGLGYPLASVSRLQLHR